MAEKFKGTHLSDGELENILIALYFTVEDEGRYKRFFDLLKDIRNEAYSIGYRHGCEDKVDLP